MEINNFVRKRRGLWTASNLANALNAIKLGDSVRKAASANNIPRKTLADYLKRESSVRLTTGPKCIFTEDQELDLVNRITRLQRVGFPLTKDDVRRNAYIVATALGVSQRFGKSGEATKRAGMDWLKLFLKRHPTISTRTSETLSYGRGAGLNKVVVDQFYDLLDKTIREKKVKPQNIYNMDESGLQMTTRKTSVLAEKGSKRVPQMATGEKGETVSIVACCSATGIFLPPLVIFKGVRNKPEFQDGLPPGSKVFMTDSGYAQMGTFKEFIKHLVEHKPSGNTLLIMDGHRSHVDVEAVELAERNDISILLLPAHTSHEIQPLDKAVFKSLKNSFYDLSRVWHNQNPGRTVNKLSFSQIFTGAWNRAATMQNAVAGFRACGIHPLNPSVISNSAFDPATISEMPPPQVMPDMASTATQRPTHTGETHTPHTGETPTPHTGETSTPHTGETSTPPTGETPTPHTGETSTPHTGERHIYSSHWRNIYSSHWRNIYSSHWRHIYSSHWRNIYSSHWRNI